MARPPDTHESHDVVITIDDEPSRCCCVCTEPLEWVAVGPCGHRDVCARCATRIRFFSGDRRCCVCRTPCPTVLVTKAGAAADDRARKRVYYHYPTGARFDSRRQYRKAVKTCVKPPPCPPAANQGAVAAVNNSLGAPPLSSQPAGVSVNLDAPRPSPLVEEEAAACLPCAAFFVAIYLCVIMILVTMFGLFFKVSENYHQKVATVVLFCLFSAGATIFAIWSWIRFRGHLNSDA
ncbi:unnamed protein product [Urochloa decumbens]|uniref:RING-type domain-containing protein n=1 Tax=Urochloa decumbens TaxID=240449 RepID=A0ABC9BSB8_9POAL